MTTDTKHKNDCRMAFGRKDKTCPRCQELLNGAEVRHGYGDKQIISNGKLKYITIAQQNKLRSQEIKSHDCKKSYCHPAVCTAFDY